LRDDFSGRQVALEPHHARQAETACKAAADLGGDAQRDPLVVGHHDRADPTAATDREDELAASVRRRRLALELRHLDHRQLSELLTKIFRQIAHGFDVENRLAIDPRRELTAPIARCAELDGEIFQLRGQ
jgi:hypothetical protein